jgi:hypothetical protein
MIRICAVTALRLVRTIRLTSNHYLDQLYVNGLIYRVRHGLASALWLTTYCYHKV